MWQKHHASNGVQTQLPKKEGWVCKNLMAHLPVDPPPPPPLVAGRDSNGCSKGSLLQRVALISPHYVQSINMGQRVRRVRRIGDGRHGGWRVWAIGGRAGVVYDSVRQGMGERVHACAASEFGNVGVPASSQDPGPLFGVQGFEGPDSTHFGTCGFSPLCLGPAYPPSPLSKLHPGPKSVRYLMHALSAAGSPLAGTVPEGGLGSTAWALVRGMQALGRAQHGKCQ